MRTTVTLIGILALLGAAAVGLALEGKNGSAVTELFTVSDVLLDIDYYTGFSGEPWESLEYLNLGYDHGACNAELSMDSAGILYFLVHGSDTGDPYVYRGVIRYDGTDFEHIMQSEWNRVTLAGEWTFEVTVSPVTDGYLLADQPVIERVVGSGLGNLYHEIVALDATSLPATETLIARWQSDSVSSSMVIDADGVIYTLDLEGGALRRFTYGSGGYTVSTLATGLGDGLLLGGDGALYAFEAGVNWGSSVPKVNADILRIDPDTGATSVHTSVVLAGAYLLGWTTDSDGKMWIGLSRPNKDDYIIEVKQGVTIKSGADKKAIAVTDSYVLWSMTGGPAGELIVLEYPYSSSKQLGDVYELVPGEGGGGGGGKPPKKPK